MLGGVGAWAEGYAVGWEDGGCALHCAFHFLLRDECGDCAGYDDSLDCAACFRRFEDVHGALYGGVDEMGFLFISGYIICRGDWRGKMHDVLASLNCFIESSGCGDVWNKGQREAGAR